MADVLRDLKLQMEGDCKALQLQNSHELVALRQEHDTEILKRIAISALKDANANAKKEAGARIAKSLEAALSDVEQAKSKAAQAEAQFAQISKQLCVAEGSNKTASTELIKQVKRERERAERAEADLSRATEMRRKLADQMAAADQRREQERNHLRERVLELEQQQSTRATNIIEDLKEKLSFAEKELLRWKAVVEELSLSKVELEGVQAREGRESDLADAIERRESDLADEIEKIKNLTAAQENLLKTIFDLQRGNNELGEDARKYREEAQEVRHCVQLLTADIAAKDAELRAKEKETLRAHAECMQAQEGARKLKAEAENAQVENIKRQLYCDFYSSDTGALTFENFLQKGVRTLKEEAEIANLLREQMSALEQQLAEEKEQVESTSTRVAALEKKLTIKTQRIVELTEEAKGAKQQAESLKSQRFSQFILYVEDEADFRECDIMGSIHTSTRYLRSKTSRISS